MILLFTDFGVSGPYVGQMTASVRSTGYLDDIIPVFSDLPAFSVKASAVLLNAYMQDFPKNSVFLCVVDPEVGSARKAIAVKCCERWFVGPDNGLFELLLRRDASAEAFNIIWKPPTLSNSFHGRDLFAPVAAKIAMGQDFNLLESVPLASLFQAKWPKVIAEVVYIDVFGNAMTGISAASVTGISIRGERLALSRTFSSVPKNKPLAYVNANGLIEIAVNQGRADDFFNLAIGTPIEFD
ncbi:MAG: SAM-dependent chlorinase/fluorinase [Sneathiella sp.]